MRWFIKDAAAKFIRAFYAPKGMAKKQEEEQAKIKEKVRIAALQLQKQIVGPYVMGEEFTMADLMIYPWFQRYFVLKETYGIEMPEQCQKIRKVKELMSQRQSVQETRKEGTD